MCGVCGCGETSEARLTAMTGGPHDHDGHRHPDGDPHDADHRHPDGDHHDDGHRHPDADRHDVAPQNVDGGNQGDPDRGPMVVFERQVLAKNDTLAASNRDWFEGRGVVAINLMSSPGSGKTTLLERTIRDVGDDFAVSVVEGDQETPLDAERIRATGCPVVQVNTGSGCHLDASMVERAVAILDPPIHSVVFIENVGNLVCPALFDLGERSRVVVMSVTEGADKPLKYPQIFRHADLVIVNKADLLPYVDFELSDFSAAVRQVNPAVAIVVVSAKTGEGMAAWYQILGSLRG